jgi:adsorption protein A
MRLCASCLVLTLALPAIASAEDQPAADHRFAPADVTGYHRFLVYPHLEKGWDAMTRGDSQRAIAEFERAHTLAPESATIVLTLADAYRTFGDVARAVSLLRGQLTRTSGDVRLRNALAALEPVPPLAPEVARAARQPAARAVSSRVKPRVDPLKRPERRLLTKTPAPVVPPDAVATDPRLRFVDALRTRPFDVAQSEAMALLEANGHDVSLLDELSYQLMQAGASAQAGRLLMQAYPFVSATALQRQGLFSRVAMLVERDQAVADETLARLLQPLDTPALRSRQAALWADMKDCGAVRSVLGDLSPEYGYDDWMRLGDCSVRSAPHTAVQAYTRGHAMKPGGAASRALGYQAYSVGDYRTALSAWRSVDEAHLSTADLVGAATTAIAAAEPAQAARWLGAYRDRGGIIDHRYWTLTAQSCEAQEDIAGAIAALEHAIDQQPQFDDFSNLARLSSAPTRQVMWLERAASIDSSNVQVLVELGYAYQRAMRSAQALETFERAATLNPDNMAVQLELGYAYWQAGRLLDAQRALERAWQADARNIPAAQQLVYIHQRLSHNDRARWFAERVLDAAATTGSSDRTSVGDAADRRFGLQRLHEDLGRRVTANVDAWSGTQVGTGTSASQPASGYRSYSQVEADYRIGRPPTRDGTTLSLFARVMSDGGDERRALPSQNQTLGTGLRWKPFRSHIFYVAAEQQVSRQASRGDVLLRTSAALLSGGRHSDDWHASGNGWFSQNLYLDAAHAARAGYTAATADYRGSYHVKLAGSQSVEPYAHIQLNAIRGARLQRDTRAGAGARWNIWYGATRYDAAPHKLTIGVEYQQAFETYLVDRSGLFLSVGARF